MRDGAYFNYRGRQQHQQYAPGCTGQQRLYLCLSGTEGLLLLEREQFDLILLDLMLPGMRGDEVLRRGRQLTQAPFLVLSAVDSLESKVELLTPGGGRLHHQAL